MVHPYFMVYIRFFKLWWQMGGKSAELHLIQSVKPPISLKVGTQSHNAVKVTSYTK